MKQSKNQSEIARLLNLQVAVVNRYLKDVFKPFKTKSRYFSDFIRKKDWFYEI